MRLQSFTKSHIFHYTHVNFDVSELLPEHSGRIQNAVLISAVLNAIKVVQIGRTLKLITFKH